MAVIISYEAIGRYFKRRLKEQAYAVVFIGIYLWLFILYFQWKDLSISDFVPEAFGLLCVYLGLFIFLQGIHNGLMPIVRPVGFELPQLLLLASSSSSNSNNSNNNNNSNNTLLVYLITIMLGTIVTFAEPAILSLRPISSLVLPSQSPVLYLMVTTYSLYFYLAVGLGVGIATLIGVFRSKYKWQLKNVVVCCLVPTMIQSYLFVHFAGPALENVVNLAYDCGGITTGEITVPVALSLGLGFGTASSSNIAMSFGIVTLASIVPIACVQTLGWFIWMFSSHVNDFSADTDKTNQKDLLNLRPFAMFNSPVVELFIAGRSVFLMLTFFIAVHFWFLKRPRLPTVRLADVIKENENINNNDDDNSDDDDDDDDNDFDLRNRTGKQNYLYIGMACLYLGLYIFLIGMHYGLSSLGEIAGISLKPILADYSNGLAICLFFAYCLGFGATLAEPAMMVLGHQAETLTREQITKPKVIVAVSLGVGVGMMLGILRIAMQWSLIRMLIPLYFVALVLTFYENSHDGSGDDDDDLNEMMIGIAWDGAGATTGPVTVPLVLAMGMAFATNSDGFGILALASVCPIITVLALRLIKK